MYDNLFDTVRQIVKTYGVTIIDDPKFWNILTDTYYFGSDHSLKDTFKECLSRGYISRIVTLRTNRKKTIAEIESITNEAKKNGLNEEETVASLYSIAIGIESCSIKDYINVYSSQPNSYPPQPKKRKRKKGNPGNNTVSFSIILMVIAGIIILNISSWLYATFICGEWYMFFVMLVTGWIQLSYCSWCMKTLNGEYFQWSKPLKRNAVSCYMPIIIGFLLNDLFPFFLCNRYIRAIVDRHFKDWDYPSRYDLSDHMFTYHHDDPGVLSIILTIIVLFSVGACGLYLFSPSYNFKKPRYKLNKRLYLAVTTIIVILYLCLFISPTWYRYSAKRTYINNKELIEKDKQKQSLTNDSIRSKSVMIAPDLSFKGIRLGISYDTAIEYARSFSNDNISTSNYEFTISHPDNIIDEVLNKKEYTHSSYSRKQETMGSYKYWPNITNIKGISFNNSSLKIRLWKICCKTY